MWPWLKSIWTNPVSARSFFRAILFGAGQILASGQIEGVPSYAGIVVSALSLLVSAGDKNLTDDEMQAKINAGIAEAAAKARGEVK